MIPPWQPESIQRPSWLQDNTRIGLPVVPEMIFSYFIEMASQNVISLFFDPVISDRPSLVHVHALIPFLCLFCTVWKNRDGMQAAGESW